MKKEFDKFATNMTATAQAALLVLPSFAYTAALHGWVGLTLLSALASSVLLVHKKTAYPVDILNSWIQAGTALRGKREETIAAGLAGKYRMDPIPVLLKYEQTTPAESHINAIVIDIHVADTLTDGQMAALLGHELDHSRHREDRTFTMMSNLVRKGTYASLIVGIANSVTAPSAVFLATAMAGGACLLSLSFSRAIHSRGTELRCDKNSVLVTGDLKSNLETLAILDGDTIEHGFPLSLLRSHPTREQRINAMVAASARLKSADSSSAARPAP